MPGMQTMTDARALAQQFGDKNMTDLRQQIVTEIMSLVRQQPKKMEPRPTIEDLEKILNSETTDDIQIEPDGSVSVRPTVTTVGAVADKVAALFQSALAAARNDALEEAAKLMDDASRDMKRWSDITAADCAVAIRALKDRP